MSEDAAGTEEPVTRAPGLAEALIAEACQRSALVWVGPPGHRLQPVWHTWHEGAVALVCGGEEQPCPVPDGVRDVHVQVRSKDAGTRLVTFPAAAELLEPGQPEWTAAATALKAERLNARDPDTLLDRWAASSRLLRLAPAGEPLEMPGHYDDSSGALPPAPSPAVTVTWRPFHLGGRRRRRRRR